MIPGDLLALLAVGLAVGSVVVERFGWRPFEARRRIAKALARVSAQRIADAVDGKLVKIVGRVKLVEPALRAPLSRRRCAFYELRERQIDENRYGMRAGPERTSELRACDFVVEDGSGRALVRAHGARIAATFKEDHGARHRVSLGAAARRFREAALVDGTRVEVGGVGRWEPDPEPPPDAMSGYREVPQRLVIEAAGHVEVLVCDLPDD